MRKSLKPRYTCLRCGNLAFIGLFAFRRYIEHVRLVHKPHRQR